MEAEMTAFELGVKTRLKRELYNLQQSDVNIYLPPCREANSQYLRDIISGNKSVSTWEGNSLVNSSMGSKQELFKSQKNKGSSC